MNGHFSFQTAVWDDDFSTATATTELIFHPLSSYGSSLLPPDPSEDVTEEEVQEFLKG